MTKEKRRNSGYRGEERKEDKKQSWHLFSCLRSVGRVTWATHGPAAKVGETRKEREGWGEVGKDDGKQGGRARTVGG